MMSIASALIAASAFGLTAVLVRKRLDESKFFSVALVVTVAGNIILWPFALLLTDFRTVNLEGILFFVIAGILAPGIVTLFYIKGMEVVGVSINASIFATYPLFSSIFAVLLLSETLTSENSVGVICIVVGAGFIERSLSRPETGYKRIFRKGLVFPLFGALMEALSFIARKHGLNVCNETLFAIAIGYASTFLSYLLLSISSHAMRSSLSLGKDFRLFWKAGVSGALGWISTVYALSHERVSIVTPLLQTEPLFVLFFAYLYLRELEHLSFKLTISTLLIVIGVILVSIR